MVEISHFYGPNVHILSDAMTAMHMTRLSNCRTGQYEVRRLVRFLYERILLPVVVNTVFPVVNTGVYTPMMDIVGKRALLTADVTNPTTMVAVATMLRAGDIPASACIDRLGEILHDHTIQQHFFGAGRVTDDEHHVVGTQVTYQKIGPLHDRILLIPDPMGATGGTVVETLDLYGSDQIKLTKTIVAMHLVIAPEYIRRVTAAYPQAQIFALRVDRGMSDPDVLVSVPGTFPDREFGLTPEGYVVPGVADIGYRLTGIA